MAKGYNSRNLLLRAGDIQTIYKANSRKHNGNMIDKDIFEKLIKPFYRISRKTFYDCLGVNVKVELEKLDLLGQKAYGQQKRDRNYVHQPSLFELETV